MGGRLRQMRGVLYRLKRAYGQPLTVVTQSGGEADYGTGRKSVTRSAVTVARAVVLPGLAHKAFKYDIGYLRANSNFTYGDLYTQNVRQALVDRADLPPDFTIRPSDSNYVVFQGSRFEVKSVESLEIPCYYLVLQETKGAPVDNVIPVGVHDRLAFAESGGLY